MLTAAFGSLKEAVPARGFQLAACGLGLSLFAWALVDRRFRDAEGFLQAGFGLSVATAVALVILGCAAAGRWKRCASWFALAVVGQAGALQLIQAGPLLHFQHYAPLPGLTETHLPLLLFLALQTGLVLLALWARRRAIREWAGRTFKAWQILGLGVVFFFTSAAPSRELPVYGAELLFAAFLQAINLGNVVLLAWAVPRDALVQLRRRFEIYFGHAEDAEEETGGQPGGVDRFAALAATWVTLLAAALSLFVYEAHPHVPDEVIYLYHARYLASGMLSAPAPPVPDAFGIYMIPTESERWYSPFPPGWPALLALGVLLGAPWLINPVLAGLNVLLTYVLVRELYPRRTARFVVLLLAVSPWYVFMAMSFMSHTFTLTCALAAAVGISLARRTRRAAWAWVAGLALGLLSLARPLDGLAMAGLLGLWAIGIAGRRLSLASIAAFGLGAVLVGAAVLPYNGALTGKPTLPPLDAYYEQYFGHNTNALGFGPERGLGWAIDAFPGHSPLEAVINGLLNAASVNVELFGWSAGSLGLVALLISSGAIRRSDTLMLAVIVATAGLYALYWYHGGPDFGARYWYLMLVPLVVLTVRGAELLERAIRTGPVGASDPGARVLTGTLALCLLAVVTYFPWRAVDKYHHYLGMRPDIPRLAAEYGFGKSIVLIQGKWHPDYESAWAYNPLDYAAEVPIYAWDRDPGVRRRVLEAYPDRPVWVVAGPTLTRRGFQVIQGPLSADSSARELENR